jgi:DNA-binding beta-propeller fold protein YncE
MAQESVPEIPFESIPEPLKLPSDLYFGEATGVAVNSKGHVFVFSRGNSTGPAYGASAAQLLECGPDGKFIREIGKNLYAWSFGHAVRVDKDDNIWAIDKGSDMVIRFNPEGRVTLVFGRKQEASDETTGPLKHPVPPLPAEDGRFRQVTDVAFGRRDIYISDGISTRIIKPTRMALDEVMGRLQPWRVQYPHIAADAKGNVYVAVGETAGLVFDSGGFLRLSVDAIRWRPAIGNKPDLKTYQQVQTFVPGAPWTVCITPPPNQVLFTSDAYPGRVYKLSLDGKVLGVLGQSGKQLKQFGWIHGIACPSENEIYVAELLNWRVQKLILHPEQQKAGR